LREQRKLLSVLLLWMLLWWPTSLRADLFCIGKFQKLSSTGNNLLDRVFKIAILPEPEKQEAISKLNRNEKIAMALAALRGGLGVEEFDRPGEFVPDTEFIISWQEAC